MVIVSGGGFHEERSAFHFADACLLECFANSSKNSIRIAANLSYQFHVHFWILWLFHVILLLSQIANNSCKLVTCPSTLSSKRTGRPAASNRSRASRKCFLRDSY